MTRPTTIKWRKLMRRTLVSALLLAVVGLAFASKGGGGEKKKDNASTTLKTSFTPIRTTTWFTLKSGPSYAGSYILETEKKDNYVSFNTLITYQKGNSTFIMPYRYKINTSVYLNNSGSNLRLLDLRVSLHK